MKSKNGFAYENIVLEAIKSAGISGAIQSTAGANATQPDADFKINDQIYNLEIKLDDKAQMGGSSITFDKTTGKFDLVTDIDPDIKNAIIKAVSSKENELIKLIDYITYEERYMVTSQKFPIVCSKYAWEKAQKQNLLVNVKIPCKIDFLKQHLFKKNIHYIQIGGKGLYHVGLNPARLPIEELQGNFTVEIRTGRSGSTINPKGIPFVGGGIRAQGRLNISNTPSRYTMDDSTSIGEMLYTAQMMKYYSEIVLDDFENTP